MRTPTEARFINYNFRLIKIMRIKINKKKYYLSWYFYGLTIFLALLKIFKSDLHFFKVTNFRALIIVYLYYYILNYVNF